jgi:molybdopterin molybdotransferase
MPSWPEKGVAISLAAAQAMVTAQAREILAAAPAFSREVCGLDAMAGRVLAEDIHVPRNQPPFDRSTRDGYAVRAADVNRAIALRVIAQRRAGGELEPSLIVTEGNAVEIMTGAALPAGADAVLMVEHASLAGHAEGVPVLRPEPGRTLQAGENVVTAGSEARAGDIVLSCGERLQERQIAMAAACGRALVSVYARPRVAILVTGDELVVPGTGQQPGPQQIYDSNSAMLRALLTAAGAEVVAQEHARDTVDALRNALTRVMAQAEFVVVTGGVSAGRFDLVQRVLEGLGADAVFAGVRMQPGKPAMLARMRGDAESVPRLILGLPGNPVSAMVTFHLFGAPLLAAYAGEVGWQPQLALARLRGALAGKAGLTRFVPGCLETADGNPVVRPVPNHGSGDLAANARANVYCIVPEGTSGLEDGAVVTVLLG